MICSDVGALIPINLLCPKAVRQLDDYLEQCVDHTLRQPIEAIERKPAASRNLVEALAVQKLTRKAIKNQLIAVLLAAKDPTSIVITWAVYELALHPETFSRLRNEIISK